MNRLRLILPVFLTALILLGCTTDDTNRIKEKADRMKRQDREMGYTTEDLNRAMAPRPIPNEGDSAGKAPELAPVISEDKQNNLPQPLVSITVNQDVPLRDIFFELGKQAEVDLELDPTITGSIIFTAYNRPFDQVVQRICDMSGLRYTFKNNVLRVERDTPYLKTYQVDYLSVTRDYTSSIMSNTSAASSSGGGGGSNGSSSTITSKSTADFWGELENNITQIISNTNQQVSLTDQSAPISTPTAIPAVPAAQLATVNATDSNGAPVAPPAATTTTTTTTTAAPTPGLLNPTGTQSVASEASATSGSGGTALQNPYFSVNKQAGLINVFASQKQHEKILSYLAQLHRSTGTQVLIEAKVFEVALNDESSTGIDWEALGDDLSLSLNLTQQPFFTNPLATTGGANAVLTAQSGDFSVIAQAINRYGHVRTLSSPRLSVMNNQTAVLNVSESRVFFDLDINRTEGTTTTPARTDFTSEVKNVPEGVIITVHPSIDLNTNEITMNLRPSITRVVRTVSDPAALIQGVDNPVPELSVRELDSIVKMHSGETIIMGGLMSDRSEAQKLGVPLLEDVPLVGSLFRSKRDGINKSEMVILLRATVVQSAKPDTTDRDLYKFGAADRHPFPM